MGLYQLRNWRAYLRGWLYGNEQIHFKGRLYAKVMRANGKTKNLGLLSTRVITTVGVKYLCDDFNANTKDVTNFKFHAWGTGTNAEAASDVALQTESSETRATGSQASATSGANATYTTVGTITATGSRAITEHGIFDSATVGGSTLWDRSVFSVINLASGDSIQFTYVLTANSGG
jgi:hypothetical protein